LERTRTLTGICLRAYPFKEADKILVVMTREEGLKRVVAKGLRKPKARVGGRLENLAENKLMLASGRTMDLLTQVDSLRGFPGISLDFELLAASMSAAELLMALLEDNDPNEKAYDLFCELLSLLTPGVEASGLLVGFMLKFLDLLGYRPELSHCLSCRGVIESENVWGLNIQAGGILCENCVGLAPGRVHALSAGAWHFLVQAQDIPLSNVSTLPGTPALLAACRKALREYSSFRAERELKAQGMFEWHLSVT
jgi:DNA repair protein RecO (recombination protein O)